ncbi:hypoxanthine phosphoribosyltransferase [Sphingobacterium hungaricum]|uniref:Hypoxanthine phosphoribosyltransferase n=1 Tax=Sphingobacterium hungaricum TaxID=2082723 RepID=A0A928UXX7_9SPHI|nr:hypoxanthine phosphoribosyltransferase [Sphingobacterium hungaricum]MBE8713139.1 hypoxanthine phosphoribosyltransferase [Sphingobacterium hungaricum]
MGNIRIDDLEFELLIDHDQIQKRIRLIGIDINVKYEHKNPVFVGVLNGCFMFMSDLMKQIHIPSELSFVKLASYKGLENEEVTELIGINTDLTGRHVVIVEDIVDTGNSLKHTMDVLERHHVASVSVCTMLLKPDKVQYEFDNIMYVGFEIDNDFVVGFGLDYNGQCRNLPDLYKQVESD